MRTELELSMYTLENTVFHLLRRRYAVRHLLQELLC